MLLRSSNLVAIPPTRLSPNHDHAEQARLCPPHNRRRTEACLWLEARKRLYALPQHIRAYVRLAWSRLDGRRHPALLLELLGHAAGQLGAAPSDFPHLDPARRRRMVHELDLAALHRDPGANGSIVFSPGIEHWVCAMEHTRFAPLLNLRQRALETGLRHIAFQIGAQSGRWRLEAAGLLVDIELHRLRPGRTAESATPWNADLCQRLIFISRSDEALTWRDTVASEPDQ